MEPSSLLFLGLALGLAFAFECVNGFHDTANAVETVIYTNSLRPTVAVVWSGLWNLTGVLLSSGAVAYGIVALLPVELVLHVGSGAGFAMVFALLISAMTWNVGTWFIGLPASSSHTLIGSIVGVGLMNSLLSPGHVFGDGVNWSKVQDTLAALVISPIVGFVGSALLLLLVKFLVRQPDLYKSPEGKKPPPLWIRAILVLTCTGVSFAHGSNDGQKGMGLIMLILIGIVPASFALNLTIGGGELTALKANNAAAQKTLQPYVQYAGMEPAIAEQALSDYIKVSGTISDNVYGALANRNLQLGKDIEKISSLSQIPEADRARVRTEIYLVDETITKLGKTKKITADEKAALAAYKKELDKATKFIPDWVKIAVALCLGLGTMVGWKRIVVTVGEKIGKQHLAYAQGGSAELVTMLTIQSADMLGLPVSTTHILSSGIAGTMFANRSGLQTQTIRNILMAWVLTLPVCVFLGAMLFAAGILGVLKLLGVH
ncbi:MAG: inorganic phosphate transporter [Candidatus Eremiobacteraeota bacterium]|nr:inorganic phosphate transporter [Candidatus Eremiobacteraeota bacterium]